MEGRERCRLCLMNIQGEDQKLKKDKLKKVTTKCQRCGEAVCNEHSMQTYLHCEKKWPTKGTMEFLYYAKVSIFIIISHNSWYKHEM